MGAQAQRGYVWSIEHEARAAPSKPAILDERSVHSYADLLAAVCASRSLLRSLRCGANSPAENPIIIVGGLGFAMISTLLAARRINTRVLPVHRMIELETVAGVEAWKTVYERDILAAIRSHGGTKECCVAFAESSDADLGGVIAYLTSGTVKDQRSVESQRASRQPFRGVLALERFGLGRMHGARILGSPTFHRGTLEPALNAIEAGNSLLIPNSGSISDVLRCANLGSIHVTSAILTVGQLAGLAYSISELPGGLRYVQHGGEPCDGATKEQWAARLGRGLMEFYGTSRGVVSAIDGVEWRDRRGSVGRPLLGVGVFVMNDVVDRASPGEVGEVVIRHRGATGFEVPGDFGRMDLDGYLYLGGRSVKLLRSRDRSSLRRGVFALVMSARATVGACGVVQSGAESVDIVVETVRSRSPKECHEEVVSGAGMESLPAGVSLRFVPPGSRPRGVNDKIRWKD